MIKAVFSVVAFAFALSSASFAEPIVVGAGKAGGGYDKWSQDIAKAFTQRGVPAVVTNFTGSDEITLGICSDKVLFAPAQQDAAYQRAMEGCELLPLWTYSSEEYMWLMVPPNSDIDELEDLTSSSKVATDLAGSGSDFTLRQLRRIEQGEEGSGNDWSKMQIDNRSLKSAMGLGAGGKLDAVFFVGTASSANLDFFLKNGWTPVEVYDKDLNDLTFNGEALYEGDTTKFAGGSVWTYRVKTFVYGKELQADLQEVFESVMSTR